jgi:hypothetical protein
MEKMHVLWVRLWELKLVNMLELYYAQKVKDHMVNTLKHPNAKNL